ncbi:Leucine carboxyl methyltransferase family protein [Theileria parva strain Muguga]|uniref:Leucine carboxyl methyltransferase family protein n=1 Tax=Theileria parva strain Muguga TaxID=333668 RepID=UPI001C61D1DB|nr:Leucine carboxyl methyltransferase family protein [Theileria parva strain Muguga]EAN31234.2 Leucine carboxyl methyltransferase family protein [Theileria parva strain Muguga]
MKLENYPDKTYFSPNILATKLEAVEKNYFDDEFMKYFCSRSHGSTLGSLFNTLKVLSIRWIIERFLTYFEGETVQFVNLGCGLDTLSLWLLSKYSIVVCFDLDLDHEIQKKIHILTHTNELLTLFPEYKVDSSSFSSKHFHALGCDLREVRNLERLLSHGFSYDLPTVFLSEFALTYLENHLSNEVIKWFGVKMRKSSLFIYSEHTRPNSCFIKWLYSNYFTGRSRVYSPFQYPTPQSQVQRFKELGWDDSFICDLTFVYNHMFNPQQKQQLTELGDLGDKELLSLTLSTCVIGTAHRHCDPSLVSSISELYTPKSDSEENLLPVFTEYLEQEHNLNPLLEPFNRFFHLS